MRGRALLDKLEGASERLNGGKRYHYDKPLNERVANRVFGFWMRMFLIGLGFSTLSSVAVIVTAWSQQRAEEAETAEAERPSKPNPWARKD